MRARDLLPTSVQQLCAPVGAWPSASSLHVFVSPSCAPKRQQRRSCGEPFGCTATSIVKLGSNRSNVAAGLPLGIVHGALGLCQQRCMHFAVCGRALAPWGTAAMTCGRQCRFAMTCGRQCRFAGSGVGGGEGADERFTVQVPLPSCSQRAAGCRLLLVHLLERPGACAAARAAARPARPCDGGGGGGGGGESMRRAAAGAVAGDEAECEVGVEGHSGSGSAESLLAQLPALALPAAAPGARGADAAAAAAAAELAQLSAPRCLRGGRRRGGGVRPPHAPSGPRPVPLADYG